jgi:predicted TIM-barrel fold metal-dependent hydrolase
MLTRRDVLRLIPAGSLVGGVKAIEGDDFTRIDSHIHIHRDAPRLALAFKESNWRGIDIVAYPGTGGESVDLEQKLRATLKVCRDSGGTLAWVSSFDARDFESPGFADRTIARLRQSFDDGAIGVKIWKTIGMSIKSKSGSYLLPDDPSLLPIYEAIQRADRTLVAHLAEPNAAWLPLDANNPERSYYSAHPEWHMFGRTGPPSKEAILTARDRVLARYPKLRVVGCHLGSDEDNLKQLARRLDAYPNFAVDMAARVRYLARGDREQAREFLNRYQDRILYATDFALGDGDSAAAGRSLQARHDRDWTFFSGSDKMDYAGLPTQGLGLSGKVLRKIFRDNALRWLPGLRGLT